MFFPDEPKVGVKTIKAYTQRMQDENVNRAILVVQQNLTPFARTCIGEISTKFHLEVFQVITLVLLTLRYQYPYSNNIVPTSRTKHLQFSTVCPGWWNV